jgi:hypothetical protein
MATKEHATHQGFIFKDQAVPLKKKTLRSFKTSGTINPATQHHITKHLN